MSLFVIGISYSKYAGRSSDGPHDADLLPVRRLCVRSGLAHCRRSYRAPGHGKVKKFHLGLGTYFFANVPVLYDSDCLRTVPS